MGVIRFSMEPQGDPTVDLARLSHTSQVLCRIHYLQDMRRLHFSFIQTTMVSAFPTVQPPFYL